MHSDHALIEQRVRKALEHRFRPAIYGPAVPLTVSAWQAPGAVDYAIARAAAYRPLRGRRALGSALVDDLVRARWGCPAEWRDQPVEAVIDLGWPGGSPGFSCEGLVYDADGDELKGLAARSCWVPVAPGASRVELWLEAAANPRIDEAFPLLGDPATAGSEPLYQLRRAELAVRRPAIAGLVSDIEVLLGLAVELAGDDPRRATILRALERMLDRLGPGDVAPGPRRPPPTSPRSSPSRPCRARIASRRSATRTSTPPGCGRWRRPAARSPERWPARYSSPRPSPTRCSRSVRPSSSTGCAPTARCSMNGSGGDRLRSHRARRGPVGGAGWQPARRGGDGSPDGLRQALLPRAVRDRDGGRVDARLVRVHRRAAPAGGPGRQPVHAHPEAVLEPDQPLPAPHVLVGGDRRHPPVHPLSSRRHLQRRDVACRARPRGAQLRRGRSGDPLARALRVRRRRRRSHPGDGRRRSTGRRISRACPGSRSETPAAFFAEALDEYPDAPVWSGELYLELHRGTFTSQARVKAANRRCEHLLREAELWAATAAVRRGAVYPAEDLERLWKQVCLLQFHDILPGSSIAWVYDDAEAMYAAVIEEAEAVIGQALPHPCGARHADGPLQRHPARMGSRSRARRRARPATARTPGAGRRSG